MWAEFQQTLVRVAGENARDCGHARLEAEITSVILCINNSIAVGGPFRASSVAQGIDSYLVFGLVKDDYEQGYFVAGDSDVSGGGGARARPRVVVYRCSEVRLSQPSDLREMCVDRVEI